ncbi:RagB/SusD family nutrient uptake outer membrane protein [Flavobacteriaceae bacterium MHTCC 0001]
MKKIVLLIIITLGLTSCNEIIEEELTGDLTSEGVFTTEQGVHLALNGAYQPYAGIISRSGANAGFETGWAMLGYGTDTYMSGSDSNYKNLDRYDTQLNATSAIFRNFWDECYRGINAANAVIGRAPVAITAEDKQDELANVLGQGYFLRAFYYYNLVRFWGDVHYTDTETTAPETEATRMPAAQVYEKIIADLELAEANLPDTQSDFGRPTVWAAKTFLADVHLTLKNYDEAAMYAEDVINNGPHSLLDQFADLWDEDNQINNEIIWAIQFTDDPTNNNQGNPAHMLFIMEYDKLNGMKRDIENGRPWKRARPTEYLISLYEDDDKRFDDTFQSVWYCNNSNGIPAGLAVGDTCVWLPRKPVSQAEKDARPFGAQIYNADERTPKIYHTNKKWVENKYKTFPNFEDGAKDFIIFRMAEVYLIASEANALKSAPDQTKALQYLNEVRMRGFQVDDVNDLPVITNVDIDVILEERAKELCAEGHRWFDLVRTGKLVERVRLHNPEGGANIQDFHVLRPIPTTQIDRTTTDFPQNPGY